MCNINLFVEPNVSPRTWRDFIAKAPKFSIALDGYVADESKLDIKKVMANFNHHEKVNRLATHSTSAQILLAIRMGLFDLFRDETGEININAFVNDPDQDVCLSWFLLKYGYMAQYTMNPILNRLVSIEDFLDSTSGAYPLPKDSDILMEIAWVFEPYTRARLNGLLRTKDAAVFLGIITDVELRIIQYLAGRGKKLPLDVRYDVIGGGKGWSLIQEIGQHSKTGLMSDGVKAYISCRQRDEATWDYVIGKVSPFVGVFDIPVLFKALNETEGCANDKWGGSDIIGGSPRVCGSKLIPTEVESVINSLIKV